MHVSIMAFIKLIFFLLFVAILSVGGSWLIEHDGTIVIKWLGYEVSTYITILVLALITLIILISYITSLISSLLGLRTKIMSVYGNYIQKKDIKLIASVINAVDNGNLKDAKNQLSKIRDASKYDDIVKAISLQIERIDNNSKSVTYVENEIIG